MAVIVSAILSFVPIAGEGLGAVTELGDVAAIISIKGAAGNNVFDVYTMVDDGSNAPLAIVDLSMAPLALAAVTPIDKAAQIRREMKTG
ncbi:uncharacterized protein PG986_013853 [Apiospora aurea]|uniref:Uncharacterized protein n=1 Tax=Apiospora aurea TaxID=335848 RepID=A0ABR1PXA9_9PEZI